MFKFQFDKLKERMDKNKKEATIIITAGSLLFAFIYFKIFIGPQIAGISALIPEVKKVRLDIGKTMDDISRKENFEKKLKQMEDEINLYIKKLPMEHEIPMLLEDISNMATTSNVKILGISPLGGGKEGGAKAKVYQGIPIMINAVGGYHELGVFINKLENADRFMEISDLKVNSNKADYRRHNIELIVSTYVLLKG